MKHHGIISRQRKKSDHPPLLLSPQCPYMRRYPQALTRDGYQCILTRRFDFKSAKKIPRIQELNAGRAVAITQLAHIFSKSANVRIPGEHKVSSLVLLLIPYLSTLIAPLITSTPPLLGLSLSISVDANLRKNSTAAILTVWRIS
jgi:hypothetical protein